MATAFESVTPAGGVKLPGSAPKMDEATNKENAAFSRTPSQGREKKRISQSNTLSTLLTSTESSDTKGPPFMLAYNPSTDSVSSSHSALTAFQQGTWIPETWLTGGLRLAT
ncbi:hypothetical protein LTR16_008796, partial [Cryomyces antarcticus]